MPSTRRIELELQVLEAKQRSFDSRMSHAVAQYNLNSGDSDILEGQRAYLTAERDKIAVMNRRERTSSFSNSRDRNCFYRVTFPVERRTS